MQPGLYIETSYTEIPDVPLIDSIINPTISVVPFGFHNSLRHSHERAVGSLYQVNRR